MSKRATIQPRWLDRMLMRWGRTMPTARGWYNVCPMLQSGIPSTGRGAAGPWDLTPADFDALHAAIDALGHKHRCVIYRAFKPWTAPQQEAELAQYGVDPRTWLRWLHDAAAEIEARMSSARVAGQGMPTLAKEKIVAKV